MITGCIIFAYRLLWEGIEVLPKIRYNQELYHHTFRCSSNYMLWQVRSPTIKIPRQYPAYLASTPPYLKKVPRLSRKYPAGFNKKHTPPFRPHIQCMKFFTFHTVWHVHISTIFTLVDPYYSVLLFWKNGWIECSPIKKMFYIFYTLWQLET